MIKNREAKSEHMGFKRHTATILNQIISSQNTKAGRKLPTLKLNWTPSRALSPGIQNVNAVLFKI